MKLHCIINIYAVHHFLCLVSMLFLTVILSLKIFYLGSKIEYQWMNTLEQKQNCTLLNNSYLFLLSLVTFNPIQTLVTTMWSYCSSVILVFLSALSYIFCHPTIINMHYSTNNPPRMPFIFYRQSHFSWHLL